MLVINSFKKYKVIFHTYFRKKQHSKLDPKSRKLIFVGYGDGIKGYRLWNRSAHNIIINRDVIFDEFSFSKSDVKNDMKQDYVPQSQQIQFHI